jgi:hypothetical protein
MCLYKPKGERRLILKTDLSEEAELSKVPYWMDFKTGNFKKFTNFEISVFKAPMKY